jgi:hypothetical protein
MALAVKDAFQAVQSLSTEADAQANLVPVHAPASTVGGISTPVGPTAPLPVINTAGALAVDGSGTITSATIAQTLFAGVVPANGFLVSNNCASVIFVSDTRTAGNNIGIQVAVGATYTTPSGYKPAGPVSVYGVISRP